MEEFHRNGQEMTECLEILRRSVRKFWTMLEISGICEKFQSSFHFFNPLLSGNEAYGKLGPLIGDCLQVEGFVGDLLRLHEP